MHAIHRERDIYELILPLTKDFRSHHENGCIFLIYIYIYACFFNKSKMFYE